MRRETKWTVVGARPFEGGEHLLKLARGPELCEATVVVGWGRGSGHEPMSSSLSVERVKVLRGSTRLEQQVEAWLAEHGDEIADLTVDGAPESPCSLCATMTAAEFLEDVGDVAPLLGFVCPACAERVECENHEDDCRCQGCVNERARHEARQRAVESRVRGGLSREGLVLLGLGVEE